MDVVLPGRALPVDRRRLAALGVAGAVGAALAEAGVPMTQSASVDPSPVAPEALGESLAALAAGYEMTPPAETALALRDVERTLRATLAAGLPEAGRREAKALYGQVLVMDANAAADLGDKAGAIRTGQLAVTLAHEAGDAETAGHAWAVVSGALLSSKSPRAAVKAAQRGVRSAGGAPAGVMALVAEADAWAALGNTVNVHRTVAFAEARHAALGPQAWGAPGYSLRSYHPGNLEAFGAAALLRVGSYAEAMPRLAEASGVLAGPTVAGIRTFVLLCQARGMLGLRSVEDAHDFAAAALAVSARRPAQWVTSAIMKMNRDTGGAFVDLAERTQALWSVP
jgi:hypothetical protein